MSGQKGSITIYLLMSLLLTTGLIFTLTESARISCIEARLRGVTYMAADSCFAEYSSELFAEYGIMALWKSEDEFTSDFNDYVQKNLSFADLDLWQDLDLYLLRFHAGAIKEIEWLTDRNGEVFIDQVNDYMQYYIVEEVLELLLEQLPLFQEGEKIAAFVEKINSYKNLFIKVANAVSAIQNASDQAKSVVNNPKTILGNMQYSMQRYEETGNTIYIAQFNVNYWNLEAGMDEMNWYLDTIRTESDNYYEYADAAQEAIDSLRMELDQDADAYSEETLRAISDQLDQLELKTADTEGDYYGIQENAMTAARYQQELDLLEPVITDIDPQEMLEHILEYQSEVDYYQALFSDFDVSELGLDADTEPVQKEDPGFLTTIGDIFSKGLLKALVGNDVSDASLNLSQLPSRTVGRGKTGQSGNILSASLEQLVLGEYILKHFGNYLEPEEETALKYEVEYVIGGKASDRDNLTEVIRNIVLLRAGLNTVSLFRDSQKMAEAESLALAIVGFTGLEPLVEAVRMLIISIWCLAEGLCDTKTIMSGGRVSFIKEPFEWTISAIGLKNFSKSVIPSATSDNGMDYADYLRVLLLLSGSGTAAFRTMDLIQANACLRYEPEFRMAECVNRVEMEAEYETKQLFTAFLFAGNVSGSRKGNYMFSVSQSYSY